LEQRGGKRKEEGKRREHGNYRGVAIRSYGAVNQSRKRHINLLKTAFKATFTFTMKIGHEKEIRNRERKNKTK
jgi:hypothetical protein